MAGVGLLPTLRLNGRFNAVLAIVRHSYLTDKDNRMIDLRLGDCLEVMKEIPNKSIDAIICDLPYGTTGIKWDSVIPFESLWMQYNRIIKDNGVIVLFGSEPFSSSLRFSNIEFWKYDWVWNKSIPTGGVAKYRPMKKHENILVFYNGKPTFNPIYEERENSNSRGKGGFYNKKSEHFNATFEVKPATEKRKPTTVLNFKSVPRQKSKHSTQKPLDLLEYLVQTYTNKDDTILDNTMGSGTTMVACKKLGRNGIGIEKEEKYFKIAQERVNSFAQE